MPHLTNLYKFILTTFRVIGNQSLDILVHELGAQLEGLDRGFIYPVLMALQNDGIHAIFFDNVDHGLKIHVAIAQFHAVGSQDR